MTTPTIQSQKLVTEGTIQCLEFDFTSIGGSSSVYLSTEHNEVSGSYVPVVANWIDGSSHTFHRIDFEVSGISCDLTGSIAEPKLKVAADSLWDISDWSSATSGFGLMDYRGLRIRRQRFFYNISTLIIPQVFYVKSVDELNPSTISFTLTPSLGSERLDRPSARKLEI
jgi:hypothetical protein